MHHSSCCCAKKCGTGNVSLQLSTMGFCIPLTEEYWYLRAQLQNQNEADLVRDFVERIEINTNPRWHMVTERPIASGPEPFRSLREPSHVANTVITRTKVINSSIPNPWPAVTPFPSAVIPAKTTTVSHNYNIFLNKYELPIWLDLLKVLDLPGRIPVDNFVHIHFWGQNDISFSLAQYGLLFSKNFESYG